MIDGRPIPEWVMDVFRGFAEDRARVQPSEEERRD